MPLDNSEMLGTERDGTKNQEYCKYCYRQGAFVNPDMTLGQMSSFITTKMKSMNMNEDIIQKAVSSLPYLNRWMVKPVSK